MDKQEGLTFHANTIRADCPQCHGEMKCFLWETITNHARYWRLQCGYCSTDIPIIGRGLYWGDRDG